MLSTNAAHIDFISWQEMILLSYKMLYTRVFLIIFRLWTHFLKCDLNRFYVWCSISENQSGAFHMKPLPLESHAMECSIKIRTNNKLCSLLQCHAINADQIEPYLLDWCFCCCFRERINCERKMKDSSFTWNVCNVHTETFISNLLINFNNHKSRKTVMYITKSTTSFWKADILW